MPVGLELPPSPVAEPEEEKKKRKPRAPRAAYEEELPFEAEPAAEAEVHRKKPKPRRVPTDVVTELSDDQMREQLHDTADIVKAQSPELVRAPFLCSFLCSFSSYLRNAFIRTEEASDQTRHVYGRSDVCRGVASNGT